MQTSNTCEIKQKICVHINVQCVSGVSNDNDNDVGGLDMLFGAVASP